MVSDYVWWFIVFMLGVTIGALIAAIVFDRYTRW